MEGLVKIGKTTRDPDLRAREVSQATGVPTPFYVAFSIQVADCHSGEEYVYAILEHNGFKRSPNREFFQMPLRTAIEVLLVAEKELAAHAPGAQEASEAKSPKLLDDEPAPAEHPATPLMEKAYALYYGHDDEIRDEEEAVHLLHKAKALNHPGAYTALAEYHTEKPWLNGMVPNDKAGERNFYQKALEILKEGAQRGHGRCYFQMARMYEGGSATQDLNPDVQSAVKCWKKYFRSQTFVNDDDEKWDNMSRSDIPGSTGFSRAAYAELYLSACFQSRLPFDQEIRQVLLPIREEILKSIRASIRQHEEWAAKQPPVLESPKLATSKWRAMRLLGRVMGSKKQAGQMARPVSSDAEAAKEKRRLLAYVESVL